MIRSTRTVALCRRRTLFLVLTGAAVATTSFGTKPCLAQRPDAIREGAAAKFDAQEKELNSRLAKLGSFTKDQGKDAAEAYGNETERFFAENFGGNSEKERQEVDDIVSSPDEGFARTALCGMIRLLGREGKRDMLVHLLASRCPKYMGIHLGVEDELVILDRTTIKDGTIVLCDAFDKSNDHGSRATIAAALRRGFMAFGVASDGDQATVNAVRSWYRANASDYRPNLDYLDHFLRPNFSYKKTGILVRVPPEKSVRRGQSLNRRGGGRTCY